MDLAQLGGPNLNFYKGAIFLQCSWYTTLLFLQFSCLFEVCREPNTPFSVVEKPSRILISCSESNSTYHLCFQKRNLHSHHGWFRWTFTTCKARFAHRSKSLGWNGFQWLPCFEKGFRLLTDEKKQLKVMKGACFPVEAWLVSDPSVFKMILVLENSGQIKSVSTLKSLSTPSTIYLKKHTQSYCGEQDVLLPLLCKFI